MRVLTVGEQPLSIEDVVSVARGECQVALPETSEWRELIQKALIFSISSLKRKGYLRCDYGLWRLMFS